MNTKPWLLFGLLFALSPGCGKQEAQPRATTPVKSDLEHAANDARHTIEREARRMQDDWTDFQTKVQGNVRKTQKDFQSQVSKQRDEMAEYAAQMAEDAKDRALDIPDVLDEFFGASGDERRDRSRGDRATRDSRRP